MASLMENLIEVLNNESQEYDQLLEYNTRAQMGVETSAFDAKQ